MDSFSQQTFEHAIGSSATNEAFNTSIMDVNGNYILAGNTNTTGNNDFYIVKINSIGNLIWTKIYGGSGNDLIRSMVYTNDNCYILAGNTSIYGAGGTDIAVMKIDQDGNLLWFKTYGTSNNDAANSIVKSSDNGFAVTGITYNTGNVDGNILILKMDSSGNLLWNKIIGGSSYDAAWGITFSLSGGYGITGQTQSFGAGANDAIIINLNSQGNLLWCKTIGTSNGEVGSDIVQLSDGGYVFTTHTAQNQRDHSIVKFDSTGIFQWSKYLSVSSSFTTTIKLINSSDNGFITSSITNLGSGSRDIYISKFNSSGSNLWFKTIGGSDQDYITSLINTSDGGLLLAGYTYSYGNGGSDGYVVKLNSGYNTCGNSIDYNNLQSGSFGTVFSVSPDITSEIFDVSIYTLTSISAGNITPICSAVGLIPIINELPIESKLEQNYPNPFNPETRIKFHLKDKTNTVIKIYNALGKELSILINENLNPGTYEASWNAENYSTGIYFYTLQTEKYSETKKMILIK